MGPAPQRWKRALITTAATLVVASIPATAQAAVVTSCSFDAGTATVTATIGSGASVTLERSGDAIALDGTACGAADVFNTDLIKVDGPNDAVDESLTVSVAGGQFAPGATVEGDGSNEIEIGVALYGDALTVQGGSGSDTIRMKNDGVDLNSISDPREYEIVPMVLFGSGSFDGDLRVNGGGGADAIALDRCLCSAYGEGGDDSLYPGIAGGVLYDGGLGNDTAELVNVSPVRTQVSSASVATIEWPGVGGGQVWVYDVETYEGGAQNDQFEGSPDADTFVGNGGNDLFIPSGGDDIVDGGAGLDSLYPAFLAPIVVDLSGSIVHGDGDDSLTGVELIRGTQYDDRFEGDATGSDVRYLEGAGGKDQLDLRTATSPQFVALSRYLQYQEWATLNVSDVRTVLGSPFRDRLVVEGRGSANIIAHYFGFGGDDSLVGGSHHDVLSGGAGDDHLNGEQGRDTCDGGPGTDDVLNCEV